MLFKIRISNFELCRPKDCLFEGQRGEQYSTRSIQALLKNIKHKEESNKDWKYPCTMLFQKNRQIKMTEQEVFNIIKDRIIKIQKQDRKVVRVGINGIEGTGKTTFCNKLAHFLNQSGLEAIKVSIDGYHNLRDIRYGQGQDSAKGYYEDAYNEIEFVEKVLKSSQEQNPNYIEAIHNLETDETLVLEPKKMSKESIILTDGSYIFKEIYIKYWDLKIYLKTDFNTALARGIKRDLVLLGGLKPAKEKYENRYHKASKIYFAENNPIEIADLIIDNSDFDNLKIIKQ